jgi:glucose-6-phosphate 1-dehydrogenase
MQDNPATIVIFGASGDLTRRKLIPALYNLYRKKRLTVDTNIIGFARRDYNNQQFRQELLEGTAQFSKNTFDMDIWGAFASHLFYFKGDLETQESYIELQDYLLDLEISPSKRLYYLAISPSLYEPTVTNLGQANLVSDHGIASNIIIEKPFGQDLASAQVLNQAVHNVFKEDQIYRIDHYLGKETAQNVLFFRFANTIFEPLWNRNYVENIQITVSESIDVGHRAGYYDSAGVLRDMFQNHLLQLFTLVAMEPPASFKPEPLRNEKVKILSATNPVDPMDVVLAQYEGYCDTAGVASASQTPTFAAVKLTIDNWRWQGVPFYLRSGKALEKKLSQIIIVFKRPPVTLFNMPDSAHMPPNLIALCLQPDEGAHLRFEIKTPDSLNESRSVDMEFHYRDEFGDDFLPEAYERLLLDALNGDASLFPRSDEIELAWKLIDPLTKLVSPPSGLLLNTYQPGSWGPDQADHLLMRGGHSWRKGCEH